MTIMTKITIEIDTLLLMNCTISITESLFFLFLPLDFTDESVLSFFLFTQSFHTVPSTLSPEPEDLIIIVSHTHHTFFQFPPPPHYQSSPSLIPPLSPLKTIHQSLIRCDVPSTPTEPPATDKHTHPHHI
ncbi:uncharacterized protein BO80DRAFT_204176 [Aspergillus ibericus CBS 121593]|uniref:Uncharacterized protein n=1 Tax=Aspergillus ibericus CBS 121593 TaxID=1448316 RepID=A0A395HAR3_9EURO|nr:hypothetical protein BO80DRAFT_204176 [Aspergillus ibericus CBS 121593]RAL04593.1 hypothetical protein BO80DRAFT_204176 [Aspergillus ibericus CBS 121593]